MNQFEQGVVIGVLVSILINFVWKNIPDSRYGDLARFLRNEKIDEEKVKEVINKYGPLFKKEKEV